MPAEFGAAASMLAERGQRSGAANRACDLAQ